MLFYLIFAAVLAATAEGNVQSVQNVQTVQNDQSGPEQEAKVLKIMRNSSSFIEMGQVYRGYDYGHVYALVDINDVVQQFNKLIKKLDEAQIEVLQNGRLNSSNGRATQEKISSFVNTSFFQLFSQVKDMEDQLQMLCQLIACSEEVEDSKMHPSRAKRQLGDVLGVISVGLSIYNLAETEALKQSLFSEEKRVDFLADQLEEQHLAINAVEKHVGIIDKELKALVDWETRLQFEQAVSVISAFLYRTTEQLLQYTEAVLSIILEKKLRPRIFDIQHLQRSIGTLSQLAEKKKLTLISTRINDVIDESVSFTASKGLVYFMLHLPVGAGEPLELYRYVKSPIALSSGKAVFIENDKEAIAVNRELGEKVEFAVGELKHCLKRRAIHLCKKGVVSKDISGSCLGALFMGQGPNAARLCTVKPLNLTHEYLSQRDERTVMFFTPENHPPVHVYITCGGKDAQQFALQGCYEIEVKHGCVLSTPFWVYMASIGARLDTTFTVRPLLQFNISMDDLYYKPIGEIERYSKSRNSTKRGRLHHHTQTHSLIAFAIAGFLMFALTFTAAAYVIWRIKRADKTREKGEEETASTSLRSSRSASGRLERRDVGLGDALLRLTEREHVEPESTE